MLLAGSAAAAFPGDPIPLIPSAGTPSPEAVTPPEAAAANASIDSPLRSRIERASTAAGVKLRGPLLLAFYAANDFRPVWPQRQAKAEALLGAVQRAGEHGLDPELFHASLLRAPDALTAIDRELLLSDAFLGYADALARGAVPIETRLDDEDLSPEPVDVAAVLRQAIESPDPVAVIEGLAPRSVAYMALRRALQAYRAGNPSSGADKNNDTRLQKLEVGLERLRWLPRRLAADRVWVNIPTVTLEFYRNDRPIFTTRVIVGEADKQSPELQTEITALVFNPPWNVPYSIATNEILPMVAKDPDYLRRHRMVIRPNGWIQQLPGAGTALGYLKFESVNRFDVYLHDTPRKALFNRDNRFLSHGCIRVQNPRELGALLVEDTVESINQAIARGSTNRRMLEKPIPTFLVYQTAFVDANGEVKFAPDIYNRDDGIWRRLHRARQVPVAQNQPASQRRG